MGLTEDSQVELKLRGRSIVIIPTDREIPTLEELLAGITEENVHPETDWGPPVGREIW